MDWNAFFKSVKEKTEPPVLPANVTPPWYDIRYWKTDDFEKVGAVVGIIGSGLFIYNQVGKK